MFGSGPDIDKNKASDKASEARSKQAGAESIGRYYSSSDGKYYKDHSAAKTANISRVQKINKTSITPTPKSPPRVIYGAGSGGSGASTKSQLMGSGSSAKPTIPQFGASKNNSKTAKQLNIK